MTSVQSLSTSPPSYTPPTPTQSDSAPPPQEYRIWHFPDFSIDIKVGPNNKTLHPEGATPEYFTNPLPRNNAVESAITDKYRPLKSASQHTAIHVKAQIKQRFGVDVDPEKTYLITFAYDKNTVPHKAVITQKISLADAARLNIQDTPRPEGMSRVHDTSAKTPSTSFEIQPYSQHTATPGENGTFKRPITGNFNAYYHGIYTDPSPDAPNTYGKDQQLPIPPAGFKDMVLHHAYKKPYDQYLNDYWSLNNNRENYTVLNRLAYLKSAHIQHHEQSLDEDGWKIAMRLTGIPPNETYLDFDGSTVNKPYQVDPNLVTKFLTFRGIPSTNIFYTQDINTKKTLLYIPGNSSPIHAFDSPDAMNKWLANELRDEKKAEAFRQHFSPKDYPSSLFYKGFDKQMSVFRARIEETGAVDFNETQDWWKEGGTFDGETIKGDPFKELQRRTEKVMAANTSDQFVLNADLAKNQVLGALKILNVALMFLMPLGVALPPVGLLLTSLSVTSGLIEAGIGIDDKVQDRPGATDRITFGLFNALKPIFTAGLGKGVPPLGGVVGKTVLNP